MSCHLVDLQREVQSDSPTRLRGGTLFWGLVGASQPQPPGPLLPKLGKEFGPQGSPLLSVCAKLSSPYRMIIPEEGDTTSRAWETSGLVSHHLDADTDAPQGRGLLQTCSLPVGPGPEPGSPDPLHLGGGAPGGELSCFGGTWCCSPAHRHPSTGSRGPSVLVDPARCSHSQDLPHQPC